MTTTEELLVERMLNDAAAAMETLNTCLGVRLGLYEALAGGPLDAHGLADRAGVHPRYAREWLEQQGAAGWLAVDGTDDDAYKRTFRLPDGLHSVLVDQDSPFYLGALPGFVASVAGVIDHVAEAFRTGGGVSFATYGAGTRHGIGRLNRPMFLRSIAAWIGALSGVPSRLAEEGSHVLDLGCGTGWSTIAIAESFPAARVHGIDLDEASVAEARQNAAARGVADRVSFTRADAAAFDPEGLRYDLACCFECLHDMADPVGVLHNVRRMLVPGGSVLIGDERVADSYTAPGDIRERLNYAFSTLHCLPATRAEGAKVEAGTVLRAPTVGEYAAAAGYTSFKEAPIDHDLWRFYHLTA
ncbi:class I SAM-dependent methyltransferase [Actinocorallia populi]|uniref:class I SAM-dependent methyltransferase n=1 Tax=Actinocorallia populi TaxID=2079200 RepID=UPI000D097218|nr:class I SAM-dependent methyltransferase [Actinocorallia populi]